MTTKPLEIKKREPCTTCGGLGNVWMDAEDPNFEELAICPTCAGKGTIETVIRTTTEGKTR